MGYLYVYLRGLDAYHAGIGAICSRSVGIGAVRVKDVLRAIGQNIDTVPVIMAGPDQDNLKILGPTIVVPVAELKKRVMEMIVRGSRAEVFDLT